MLIVIDADHHRVIAQFPRHALDVRQRRVGDCHWGARTMPAPTALGENPCVRGVVSAELRTAARYVFGCSCLAAFSFCAQSAATPATCGVAMLVPSIDL